MTTNEKKNDKLVDRFLSNMQDAGKQASLYLVSGFQMKGEVVEFDDEAVLFKHKGVHQLVMRTAVASMYPLVKSRHSEEEWWRAYSDAEVAQTADA